LRKRSEYIEIEAVAAEEKNVIEEDENAGKTK